MKETTRKEPSEIRCPICHKLIKEYYSRFKEFSCENTAVNVLTWQNKFGFEFCVYEDIMGD